MPVPPPPALTGDPSLPLRALACVRRVKGLSFHPKRPWILASLHSGVIQVGGREVVVA